MQFVQTSLKIITFIKKRMPKRNLPLIGRRQLNLSYSSITSTSLIFLLLMAPFFTACNFNNQANETIHNQQDIAISNLDAEIMSSKKRFDSQYEEVLKNSNDSALKEKVKLTFGQIQSTIHYIDSLRENMGKMSNTDLKAIEYIKTEFLTNGVGDSLFAKIIKSYSLIIDNTHSETTKTRLSEIQSSFNTETQKGYFNLNSPTGVSMVLFGMEQDLLTEGISNFSTYKNN